MGLLGGITGMHFVVVTAGGGGLAQTYRITDPWDGTTTKTLGSYFGTGSNSYDGPSRNCGRLVQAAPPALEGVHDGDVTHGKVHLAPNPAAGQVQSMTLQRLSGGGQSQITRLTGPTDVTGDGVWQAVTVLRRPDGTTFVSVTKFTNRRPGAHRLAAVAGPGTGPRGRRPPDPAQAGPDSRRRPRRAERGGRGPVPARRRHMEGRV